MLSYRALAAAAAVIAAGAGAPALADSNVRLQSTLLADIGRDQITLSQHVHTPARIISMIVDMPAFEAAAGIGGEAVVRIDLNRRGRVTAAAISTSSGSARFDAAAIAAANAGTYAPETIDGSAVGGTYAVDIDFTP